MSILRSVANIANPRDGWPDWTDNDRWSTSEPARTMTDREFSEWAAEQLDTIDDDTTDHAVELEPTPEEQAWKAGFDMGYQGETAVPPSELAEDLVLSWWRGYGNGETRRDREEILALDFEPRQYPEPDYCELVEHCGIDFARTFGRD